MRFRLTARLLVGSLLVALCSPVFAQWQQHQWDVMGTRASVTLWSTAPAAPVFRKLEKEMARLNQLLSPWVEDSELARLNRKAASEPQTISDEFYQLLERSAHYYQLTDGAFDITFASAGHLYDYREGKAPDEQTLQRATQHIGASRIQLQDNHQVRFTDPGTRIDLGGIAKGYAIDRGIALLKAAGIEHAWLSLGGDSYVLGDHRGRPWEVGIQHPRDRNDIAMRLPIADIAMSTSGDYQRYFIQDGERIHHILTPQTGKSAGELVSVTVLCNNSMDADALSTSVFVLGKEKGLALINRLPDTSAILIDQQGRVSYSSDLTAPP
ncbi:MAG: FAD:protein FMN transferase [Pseudomonadales bacterium]|uniref:FAD:protein FMN transferase n=1 Tax=Alcanivorax sp. MD8A TaxID=1177157 RepID=UPI000C9CBCD9|nr:FAD:protein FMN transferase [Alcanivorax sp. MD8A]MCG8438421.1 FAD:protein FMN transferase [Pseudomonadales bacterium]PNE02285.1 membrane protein [Alcanivorax sp. MD8A]